MYFMHHFHYESIRYMWRSIKTIPNPNQVHRAGTVPPVLKLIGFSNESSAFTSQSDTHKLALLHFKALLLDMLYFFVQIECQFLRISCRIEISSYMLFCHLEKQMLRCSFILVVNQQNSSAFPKICKHRHSLLLISSVIFCKNCVNKRKIFQG